MPVQPKRLGRAFLHAAGTAAALNGFVITVVAFGIGHWLGQRMDGTVLLRWRWAVWFWSRA